MKKERNIMKQYLPREIIFRRKEIMKNTISCESPQSSHHCPVIFLPVFTAEGTSIKRWHCGGVHKSEWDSYSMYVRITAATQSIFRLSNDKILRWKEIKHSRSISHGGYSAITNGFVSSSPGSIESLLLVSKLD